MVKTRNPLSSEAASGKLGNQIVFKPRGQVQTAARRSAPANPQTTRQQIVRAVWSTTANLWATLTPAQAQAWEDYARAHPTENNMGQLVTITGFDAYCQCARPFVEQFGAAPAAPLDAYQGLTLSAAAWGQLGPGAMGTVLSISPFWPGNVIIQAWRQGPLANPNRALRQPEQRFHSQIFTLGPLLNITGLESGQWYYLGARLCPPGAFPGPVLWSGPYLTL